METRSKNELAAAISSAPTPMPTPIPDIPDTVIGMVEPDGVGDGCTLSLTPTPPIPKLNDEAAVTDGLSVGDMTGANDPALAACKPAMLLSAVRLLATGSVR